LVLKIVKYTLMFNPQSNKIQLKKPSRRKKIVKIILIVFVCTILVLGFLFFKFIVGLWPWQMNETQSLTTEEIEARAGTFLRNYPEIIKGNWEPGADHLERMIVLDEQRIKDLGLNTVSVVLEYKLHKDGSYTIAEGHSELSSIVRAKEKGFAVHMAISFVGMGFGHNYEKKGITKDYYLEISEKVALEWAEIAEKYQVEFFCPQQELDFIIRHKFKRDEEEVAKTLEDWYTQVLPKIKKVYNGKTMVKISQPEKVLKLPGYDYMGMTLFHESQGLDGFRELAKQKYDVMQDMAIENNAKWYVAEAFLPAFKKNQAEYFRISTEEYLAATKKKPSGYLFTAWTMPFLGISIKGEASEKVLRDFFNNL